MPGAKVVSEEHGGVRVLAMTSERLTDAALVTTAEPRPRIVFANSAFLRLTGHTAAALRLRSLGVLQRTGEFQEGLAKLHPAIMANGSFFAKVRLRGSDGRTLIVEWQATPVVDVDESGPARYLFSIVRDASHQRRERRALARERERTQVTLAAVGDAVVYLDVAGRIEEMNPAAENLSQWPAAEAGGRSAADVFRMFDAISRDAVPNPVASCMSGGGTVVVTGRLLLPGRDGRETPVAVRAAPLREEGGGVRGAVLVLREDTERAPAGAGGAADPGRDQLTGLMGRREFERRLETAAASARQYGRSQVLLHIDLDHFKQVNEAFGRSAGDEVLRQVAGLLRARFRERDALARLGGDSFGLLLDNCSLEKAETIAENTVASLASARFPVAGHADGVIVIPSIGLVEVSPSSGTAEQLLTHADLACYTAKELGRGRSHIYRSDRQAIETAPVVLFPEEFRAALEESLGLVTAVASVATVAAADPDFCSTSPSWHKQAQMSRKPHPA